MAALVASVAIAGGGAALGFRLTDWGRSAGNAEPERLAPSPQLPRGGRRIFPQFRVVAFYGAPQDEQLGALGVGGPRAAAHRLERQARPYRLGRRPVLPAFELIATVAQAAPGDDGDYSVRQRPRTIGRYLRAARKRGCS